MSRRLISRRVTALAGTVALTASGLVGLATVAPSASAAVQQFCNTTPISINSASTADPYPSSIDVAGITGVVRSVTVTFKGLSHPYPYDLTTQVGSPGGARTTVTERQGPDDQRASTGRLSGDYSFSNTATQAFPGPAGSYAPTSPLPSGGSPNGTWDLFVSDLANVVSDGEMNGGWCVTIDAGAAPTTTTATVSPDPSTFGQSVTVDPAVSGSPTVGRVRYSVDGGPPQDAPGAVGDPFSLTGLSAGTHTVQVFYTGVADQFEDSQSAVTSFTVDPAASAATVSVSPVASTFGDSVTVDPGVTGTPTPSTGSLTYSLDGAAFQAAPGTFGAPFVLGGLSAGSHTVQTKYVDPAGNYTSSTSPLVIFRVAQAATRVVLTTTPSRPVAGQDVVLRSTVDGGRAGTVQYTLDDQPVGGPVASGTDGPTLTLPPGTYRLGATFTPTDRNYAPSTGTNTLVVDKAGTATTVEAGSSGLTARVSIDAPGSGTPTGTVAFTVDGEQVGSAPLGRDGTAVLDYAAPAGSAVVATYSGDDDFAGSSSARPATKPSVAAQTSSSQPASRFGWFRTPVTVSFTCASTGSTITSCTAPVRVTASGVRSVTGTATAANGGTASVTRQVRLDRVGPTVRATGVRNGATYAARPNVRCAATDTLSGVASCRSSIERTGARAGVKTFRYRVVAVDKAGNTSTKTGRFRIR